jgi:hypothetical protein
MAWELLNAVLLDATAATLSSDTFDAKKNLQINFYKVGANVNPNMTFNSVSLSEYAWRYSGNNGTDATVTSQSKMEFLYQGATPTSMAIINIVNIASLEKLVIINDFEQNASGSGSAPNRMQVEGKWTNTSDQITSVQFANDDTGTYQAGSYIQIWGTD